AALERVHHVIGIPTEIGAAIGAAFSYARREWVTLGLAGIALAWIALVCAMTQAGFSGNARYFLPAVVILCLLAGLGIARLVDAASRLSLAAPRPVVLGAAAIVVLLLALPDLVDGGDNWRKEWRASDHLAKLQSEVPGAV